MVIPTARRATAYATLLLLLSLSIGMASANHPGTPGGGDLDGWVDAHGDTMYGDLNIANNDILLNSRRLDSPSPGYLRWDGGRVCVTNVQISGCGDISEVVADTGLSGGGLSGTVKLSVDTSTIQSRVTGVCATGSSIRAIDSGGNVVCEIDDEHGGSADLLDGLDSTQFLRSDTSDTFTGSKLSVSDLHVNGDLTHAPRTRHFSIPAPAFTAELVDISGGGKSFWAEPTYEKSRNRLCMVDYFDENKFGLFYAPVHLPDGAVVTKFKGTSYDTHGSEQVSVSLWRESHTGRIADEDQMAITPSRISWSGGITSATDLSIDHAVIDNGQYTYVVMVELTDDCSTLQLRSVMIEYTVTSSLP